jgi:proteasome accessory factor A
VAERLFGLETEYAFTALDSRGAGLDREEALGRLMRLARDKLSHLPDVQSNGIFLQNGSRFYIDHGLHPELSTPECANPWDAVRYILAGERILADLADNLVANKDQISEAMFFRCNVDYSGTQSTWGCHESYLHRADPAVLPQQLMPHLVSRLIYTGAGGFNSLSPGVEFTLSPRVPHLVREVSDDSTSGRGIFHTKDESLCGKGYHRLHLLCGESLCSETATWLKVGTTALVVAMIEAGLRPGDAVELQSPLGAMRCFARDIECKAIVESANGKGLTAIAIQRHYLTQAEAHVHDAFMPPWAEEVCRQWRAILDRLESAPKSMATVLDWGIKLALYKDRVCRRGMAWESLPHWTHVLVKLCEALQHTEYRNKSVSVEFILGKDSPIADEVKRLTPLIRRKGLAWDGLGPFLALRQELFEIDTRFGQLGDKGIFAAMDRAGVLAQHVPGVDNLEYAIANPPAVGRARVRGECIRRFAGNNDRYVCDWQEVCDRQARRVLDLSDPFETEERWQDLPKDKEDDDKEDEPGLPAQPRQCFAAIWREVAQGLRTLRLRA